MAVFDGHRRPKKKLPLKSSNIDRHIRISIGNYAVREVLMKNRTRVWRNVYNTASA